MFSVKRSSAALAAILFALLLPTSVCAEDRKQALTDQQIQAQQAYEDAQKELNEIQSQQQETESQIGQLEGQAAQVAGQLQNVYVSLQDAEREMLVQQAAADQAAQALAEKQAEYNACFTRSQEQMRAMQMLDGGVAIGLLSQAKSLYQLLTFADVLQQISSKNSEILTVLTEQAQTLSEAKQKAETARQQAEVAKAALDAQQAQLSGMQAELETALLQANETLSAQESAAQAQAVVTEAAKKAYEDATAALDAYVRAQSDRYTTADLVLTSLDFRCPLDSYSSITTQFGEADPWGIPHRGTDFAAPNGTPIYAIADGIISAAGPVNSYGNCVQVSHGTASDGNRYDSLYAHMSRIAVNQGQTVQKGEVIGYVGNTGNVYGANGGYHLHLELRVNGSRVNPLAYVPR